MIINLKSPLLWIFIIGLLTFIVATACLSLANWLAILSSVGWLLMAIPALIWLFSRYFNYKRKINDKRFQDAYIYAEDQDDPELIKKFGYDRKTERKISYNNFNNFLTPLCGVLFVIIGIVMLVTSIQNLG